MYRFPAAVALTLAALTSTLAGCGGDSSGGIIGPPEEPPEVPTDPGNGDNGGGDTGPAPVGTVMYAVDLSNNFLVFGSGSIGTLTAKMKIHGLPLLKRVIGLAIRPSDGALIAVGNDSRVYKLDPLSAEATPIAAPFTPAIASFFDIHFAMALEPNGTRVRLISAESGANWSIDINNGTATTGKSARYGAGQPLAGHTPRLLGIVYPSLPAGAKGSGWCPNLAYSADADEAVIIASCDPNRGFWYEVGRTAPANNVAVRAGSAHSSPYSPEWEALKDQLLRCGEWMQNVTASNSEGEEEPAGAEGGPWYPKSPDTEFWVFLVKVGELQNRSGTVKLIDGQKWGLHLGPTIPSQEPVQSVVIVKGSSPYYSQSHSVAGVHPTIQAKVQNLASEDPGPAGDPRASCTGGTAN